MNPKQILAGADDQPIVDISDVNVTWTSYGITLRGKPNGQRPKKYIAEAAHDQEVCRLLGERRVDYR